MMRYLPVGTGFAPNWEDSPPDVEYESIVETRGYMTLQQQIERALAAGILYEDWRQAHFPPGIEIPDDFEVEGYEPDEMDIMAQYQHIVDGRTRTLAKIERAQWRAERDAVVDPSAGPVHEPVKDPRIPDSVEEPVA